MEGGCRAIFKWDSDRPAFHLTIHTRVGCPVRVRPLLLPLPPALRYGCLRLQSRLVGKLRAMVPRSRLGAESGPHPIRALVPRVTGSVPFPWVTFLRLCPACSPLSVSWGGPAKAHRAHTLEQQTPTLSEAWRRTSEGRCRQSLWPRPLSWPWHCPRSLAAPG